jgi:AcrR family transcriptional regulator
MAAIDSAPGARPTARERILETAYELFSRRGVRGVGVDEVIARAGVAKATLYAHFPSKDALALAFLERREQLWTLAFIETESRRRSSSPEGQLLAIFDVLDEWFRREDFEGCSFVRTLLELGGDHAAGRASVRHMDTVRSLLETLAQQAGLRDAGNVARSFQLLMQGAVVAAEMGDADAGLRAKALARLLIERHR